MKNMIAIITVLLAAVAVSAPIRSMIAARSSINAPATKTEYTAKDYIQDGLVAMWDGIENAGPGKHDDKATVWVDISGNGYDLTSLLSGGWVDGNARLASKSASGTASTIPLNDILTISVCCYNVMLRSPYS